MDLNLKNFPDYESIKSEIFRYLENKLGKEASGAIPMDIDGLQKDRKFNGTATTAVGQVTRWQIAGRREEARTTWEKVRVQKAPPKVTKGKARRATRVKVKAEKARESTAKEKEKVKKATGKEAKEKDKVDIIHGGRHRNGILHKAQLLLLQSPIQLRTLTVAKQNLAGIT